MANPTQPDSEVHDLIYSYNNGHMNFDEYEERLLALIATQRQEAAQAARREALELAKSKCTHWGNGTPVISVGELDELIATLGDAVGEQR